MPPTVKLNGHDLLLGYESGSNVYFKTLGSDLGKLNSTEAFADVTMHCDNGTVFRANRLVLITASKLFQSIFGDACNCSTFMSPNYEVILPGKRKIILYLRDHSNNKWHRGRWWQSVSWLFLPYFKSDSFKCIKLCLTARLKDTFSLINFTL